jgi:hypothetical protein
MEGLLRALGDGRESIRFLGHILQGQVNGIVGVGIAQPTSVRQLQATAEAHVASPCKLSLAAQLAAHPIAWKTAAAVTTVVCEPLRRSAERKQLVKLCSRSSWSRNAARSLVVALWSPPAGTRVPMACSEHASELFTVDAAYAYITLTSMEMFAL